MLDVNSQKIDPVLIQARLLVKLNDFPDKDTSDARLTALDAIELVRLEMIVPTFRCPGPATIQQGDQDSINSAMAFVEKSRNDEWSTEVAVTCE